MSEIQGATAASTFVQGAPTVTMATVLGLAAMLLISGIMFLTDGGGLPVIGSGLTGF